ncbi:MAG: GNAT family N-acetyltransferase [Hyphomicrobiales bacterium]
MVDIEIELLDLEGFDHYLNELAGVLHACVQLGASVNFILPFSINDSRAFWRNKIREGIASKKRILIVAKVNKMIAGTVQLDCDTPPNQAHRADVSKLLVHPEFRRQGVAKLLMNVLEEQAKTKNIKLLTLDTRTGDSAEPLYASLGYQTAGIIPNFAKNAHTDTLDGATFMYKEV